MFNHETQDSATGMSWHLSKDLPITWGNNSSVAACHWPREDMALIPWLLAYQFKYCLEQGFYGKIKGGYCSSKSMSLTFLKKLICKISSCNLLKWINLSFFFLFKCDQTKEGLVNNSEQMEEFCKEKGFLGWFETSAKENINIDEAARFLVSQVSLLEIE